MRLQRIPGERGLRGSVRNSNFPLGYTTCRANHRVELLSRVTPKWERQQGLEKTCGGGEAEQGRAFSKPPLGTLGVLKEENILGWRPRKDAPLCTAGTGGVHWLGLQWSSE